MLLLVAAATAEKTTMKASFGGGDAGTNVFELTTPDTLVSTTDFNIAGTKMTGTLKMTTAKGRLVAYELRQKLGPTAVDTVLKGLKVTVNAGGKSKTTTLKNKPVAGFANFHPQTLRTVLAAYDQVKGGKQEIPTILMDSGAELKFGVTKKGVTPFVSGSQPVPMSEYEVTIGTVAVTVLQDSQGEIVGINVPSQGFAVVVTGFEGAFVDPTTKHPELSQPTMSSRVEKGVKIPLRDGVVTVADVAFPDAAGKYPTILIRTPYGRVPQFAEGKAGWWAKRGYVMVVQDCRGRHDSGGEWDPFMHERKDGYDTIEWIAKQPWSDGNVGMIGASYSGGVQWEAAVEAPPALKCIVPQVPPPDPMFNLPYDYGTFPLFADMWWTNIVKKKITDLSLAGKPLPHGDKLNSLPLSTIDLAVLGMRVPFWHKWLERTTANRWVGWNYEDDLKNVQIPALMISGWFDGDGIGTKRNWKIMAGLGRTNQWLIDGPWPHAFNSTTSFGGVDYGPTAVLELDSVYLRWFDTWLKHKEVGIDAVPKVQVFVGGVNEWRNLNGWPDSRSTETALYLSALKAAPSAGATGELVAEAPASQAPSVYVFDPTKGVAPKDLKVGADNATTAVKFDSKKGDELLFETPPLTTPVELGGPISIDLWFSTSARDLDLFGMVVDIDPKGVQWLIGMPGKIRASYLSGWNSPKPLVPGKLYKATLEHWDSAHAFLKGHRIGLLIMSGMFPGYARNLGTGEPIGNATRGVKARETIYHDAKHPSCLRFMLLPAK